MHSFNRLNGNKGNEQNKICIRNKTNKIIFCEILILYIVVTIIEEFT